MLIDPRSAPELVKGWLESVRPAIDREIGRQLDARRRDASGDSASADHDPADGDGDEASRLAAAMRYAVLGPGKRLRPALVLAACEAAGGAFDAGLPAAAAVELLHAYTLVHDDLPAMDDDDERRGRPTVHVAFGEAIAILAGDGLLTAAFGALADLEARAPAAVRMLAERAGAGALLAGQARDLAMAGDGAGARPSFERLERVHADKTGALFAAAAELGAIAAGAGGRVRARFARYGMAIGVAFQHADDIDDGDFPEYAERARARMQALTDEAAGLASELGTRGDRLVLVARWIGMTAERSPR